MSSSATTHGATRRHSKSGTVTLEGTRVDAKEPEISVINSPSPNSVSGQGPMRGHAAAAGVTGKLKKLRTAAPATQALTRASFIRS